MLNGDLATSLHKLSDESKELNSKKIYKYMYLTKIAKSVIYLWKIEVHGLDHNIENCSTKDTSNSNCYKYMLNEDLATSFLWFPNYGHK